MPENDNKTEKKQLPEVPMVRVSQQQLNLLIAQRNHAVTQANEMKADFQLLAETYSKLFDELGITKDASKMMMFTKMTKFAKRILLDGDVPDYFKNNRFAEMLHKYSTLQPHQVNIEIEQNSDNENTSK
jgi:NRPS condensation-like uncharacterized protein